MQSWTAAFNPLLSPPSPPLSLYRLKHKLEFTEERLVVAKDANIQNEDTFDIYDPRNPLNKRRRGENEKESKRSRDDKRHDRTKR